MAELQRPAPFSQPVGRQEGSREGLCGCFRPDLNPDAPDVILSGRGPKIERWARVFATQRDFIPCFVKAATNAWEYVGRFRVRRVISDTVELGARARAASRPPKDLSMILYLRGR